MATLPPRPCDYFCIVQMACQGFDLFLVFMEVLDDANVCMTGPILPPHTREKHLNRVEIESRSSCLASDRLFVVWFYPGLPVLHIYPSNTGPTARLTATVPG